ncbi:ethanolamine ammonia-lyase subunit EutC [Haladaptatus pallidirubidus]|uniref:Putative ethanolamine ammonia-lyase small subunit n=1 Tax=Haladaptatus pallidirubidus TaxID=1008152 RepID=A0AAV3URQ6_9EURY|nr:ethanolamine ammonia-lyase subunit EutC [Haladaptatus pallidirubidus]
MTDEGKSSLPSPPATFDSGDDYSSVAENSPARLSVGRSGPRLRTETSLQFRADHAAARDAVLTKVSQETIDELDLVSIKTLVSNQDEYLENPNKGRDISAETADVLRSECTVNPDVQIIVCDGLSSTAVENNIRDLLPMVEQGLKSREYDVGTSLFVKFGRVNVMDAIGEELNAQCIVNLIGERPGLQTAQSLSAYMVYNPVRGKSTAKKTVISNIHSDGLPPVEAGAQIVEYVEKMLKHGGSGLDLEN